MTGMTPIPPTAGEHRVERCAGCGAEFGCSPSADCWCAGEHFRLPLPVDGGRCLCPRCLRARAVDVLYPHPRPDPT